MFLGSAGPSDYRAGSWVHAPLLHHHCIDIFITATKKKREQSVNVHVHGGKLSDLFFVPGCVKHREINPLKHSHTRTCNSSNYARSKVPFCSLQV